MSVSFFRICRSSVRIESEEKSRKCRQLKPRAGGALRFSAWPRRLPPFARGWRLLRCVLLRGPEGFVLIEGSCCSRRSLRMGLVRLSSMFFFCSVLMFLPQNYPSSRYHRSTRLHLQCNCKNIYRPTIHGGTRRRIMAVWDWYSLALTVSS